MDLIKISILKKGNLFKEAKSLKENHASYLYAIFTAGFYRFFQSKILIEINSILGQKGKGFTFSGYPNFTIHMYGV